MQVAQQELHQQQIIRLFSDEFQIEVPSIETDLIDEGLLDSLVFVELIVHLEQLIGGEISLDELDLEQFRSITQIAQFVNSLSDRPDSDAPTRQTPVESNNQKPKTPTTGIRQEPNSANETVRAESQFVAEVRQ